MRIETPLVAILLASLFFTGIYSAFTSIADVYEVDYNTSQFGSGADNTELTDALNKMDTTKDKIDEVSEEFNSSTVLDKNTGNLFPFFSMTYKIGKMVYNSLYIVQELFVSIGDLLGIPSQIIVVAFALILLSFIIMVLFILLGRSI